MSKYIKKGTGAYVWTRGLIVWAFIHAYTKTNRQLAEEMKMGRNTLRHKLYELGLQRIEMEYWTADQKAYLLANYQKQGNVELADNLNKLFPKHKPWTKNHVIKKLMYLKIKRTVEEYEAIRSKNSSIGGNAYTIDKNSSSKNMHPTWLVNQVSRKDTPEIRDALKKDPDALALIKQNVLLKRAMKNAKRSILDGKATGNTEEVVSKDQQP